MLWEWNANFFATGGPPTEMLAIAYIRDAFEKYKPDFRAVSFRCLSRLFGGTFLEFNLSLAAEAGSCFGSQTSATWTSGPSRITIYLLGFERVESLYISVRCWSF